MKYRVTTVVNLDDGPVEATVHAQTIKEVQELIIAAELLQVGYRIIVETIA